MSTPKVALIGSSGYVGSYLFSNLKDFSLVGIDRFGQRSAGIIRRDFSELEPEFWNDFDYVLFFAGVSSVPIANQDPSKAFDENVLKLARLAQILGSNQTLVFASTGSLATNSNEHYFSKSEVDAIETLWNPYDSSKLAAEQFLFGQKLSAKMIGLRMGTVSGASPNMRWDLVVNSMCRSAVLENKVYVANAGAMRSLLFLPDLAVLISEILRGRAEEGLLNVASQTISIGNLADNIADFFGVEVETGADTPTYNFGLDTKKMTSIVGQGRAELKTILSQLEMRLKEGKYVSS